MSVTSSESITRARRKIQENGYFKSSKKVFEARKELEYEYKSEALNDRFVAKAIPWMNEDD